MRERDASLLDGAIDERVAAMEKKSQETGPRVHWTGHVPAKNHDPYGFRERFTHASVEELVTAFNSGVGSTAWVRARGEYLFALKEALVASGLDCSSFIAKEDRSMSLARRIRVEGHRLVPVDDESSSE